MNEAVEIPDPVMLLIENLKNRPDEKPIEVITRALEYYSDDYIDEETEEAVREKIKEQVGVANQPCFTSSGCLIRPPPVP